MSDDQEPIIEKLADLHFDEELVSTNPADIFSDDLPSDAELTNEELADNLDAFDAGLTSEELVDLLFDELATRPSVDLGRLRRAVRSTVRLSKHEAENATMRVTQLACLQLIFECFSFMGEVVESLPAPLKRSIEKRTKTAIARQIAELKDAKGLSFGEIVIKLKSDHDVKMSQGAVKKAYKRQRKRSKAETPDPETIDLIKQLIGLFETLRQRVPGGDTCISPQNLAEIMGTLASVPFARPSDSQQS